VKVIILAGGLGTRLSEETERKPKPLVEIGGVPILWHIMSIYASFGINDFILSTGYKSELIEKYASELKIGA
jgi:glucose-1-phosphate cytidylyltransferase